MNDPIMHFSHLKTDLHFLTVCAALYNYILIREGLDGDYIPDPPENPETEDILPPVDPSRIPTCVKILNRYF